MTRFRRPQVLLIAMALLPLAACEDDPTGLTGFGTIVIELSHVVGSTPLQMNTGSYMNAAGNQYMVTKLEYVLSDFVFTGATANHGTMDVHYADAGDAGSLTLTLTDVPAGEYTSLDFVHGLLGANNATGAFPSLDADGMAWPMMMGGGYHYMRNEGTYTPTGGGTANFTTHTGPTGGNDFSVLLSLTLPSTLRLDGGNTATVDLQMDVNEWYTNPNDYDFNNYGAIMGNAVVQGLFQANGASVWSVASVTVN